MLHSYQPDSALIVVDMQNDFADPSGSLYVRAGETILEAVLAEIRAAKEAGAMVVFTQDWHPSDTPHFVDFGGIWPSHCVRDTWGAQFVKGLEAEGPVIRKGVGGEDGYSGFTVRDPASGSETPTALRRLLEDAGVARIVVVGLALDYCVKFTAIDGAAAGFDVTLVGHATKAVDLEPGDGEKALDAMKEAGIEIK